MNTNSTGISITIAFSLLMSCSASRKTSVPKNFPSFYKEGHRGARGLMPENTIPSMKKAIEAGANVVEVDIYITKDGQVLVAHDPYVNVTYSQWMDGREITPGEARNYVWHKMNYSDIRKIDVGSRNYPAFPQQQRIKTYMPLFGELIDSVEAYTTQNNLPGTIYNIELKTSMRFDTIGYNAPPAEVVKRVMDVIKSKNIGNRYYIQSFDMRPLQMVHKNYPGVAIGFLTSSMKESVEDNIKNLGFVPDIYSPNYMLVTAATVEACKKYNMKLVPWTVNTLEEIKKLVGMGVNGIITDYPNLFAEAGL